MTDFLPPTFVREWRQLLRSKAVLILIIVAYALAWFQFLTIDWNHIQEEFQLIGKELTEDWSWTDYDGVRHVHRSDPHARFVCNAMADLNRTFIFIGSFVFSLLIPLRVGNVPAADTKVKGTNFLQVTPLNSWSIVSGTWLAALSQILILGLMCVPLLLVRGHLMPTGQEYDLFGLGYMMLASAGLSAVFMFAGSLNNGLRYSVMGVALIVSFFITGLAGTRDFYRVCVDAPLWSPGASVVVVGVGILLLLQLTRRAYAAPAENMALPVRLISLACMVAAGAGIILTWSLTDKADIGAIETYAEALLCVGCAGAVLDAVLPCSSMPEHARRTLPFLPTWPQVPGVLQAALFLLLVLLCGTFISDFRVSGKLDDLLEYYSSSSCQPVIISLYVLHAVVAALTLWTPALLSLFVADFFCRRNSSRRPFAIGVACMVLCFITVLLGAGLPSEEAEMYLPIINCVKVIDIDMWRLPSPDLSFQAVYGYLSDKIATLSGPALAWAVFSFSLLVGRVRISRSSR